MNRFLRTLHDDSGAAMVVAILTSMIVLMLSISAVAISVHNTDASGYDKRRLLSVDAAEAGIDRYYQILGSTGVTGVPLATTAGTCVLSGTLTTTTPSTQYTVTPKFYTSDPGNGTPPGGSTSCPSATSTYVVLDSVGRLAATSTPTRTVRSKARISVKGNSIVFPAAAIYGSTSVDLSANIQVYGNGANNADIYSNGDLTVSTASNLKGNIYVQGAATIRNGNFQLAGDLWAKNGVTISGGKLGHDVISSTSTIAMSGNSAIYNNAKAGSTISVSNPATISGTQSPNTSGIGNPPTYTYPTYTYTANDWNTGNATINGVSVANPVVKTDCTSALNAISQWTAGPLYLRVTGCTTLNLASKSITWSTGNLGIITNGNIAFASNTRITNSTSTVLSMYLFSDGTSPNCNLTTAANAGFSTNMKVLVYTPSTCSATISSNSWNAAGQMFSGTVRFSSNTTLTYAPVNMPKESNTDSGWLIDEGYRREV